MNILFITTHNLATNPRLVKEIELANNNGITVQLLCFEFDHWSSGMNREIISRLMIKKMYNIQAGRSPFFPWFISVFVEKFSRLICKMGVNHVSVLANAVSRRNYLINKHIRDFDKPDWVIGHNPGSLYSVSVAKKYFSCKSGCDVEDYYPGEGNDRFLQQLSRRLMQATLPDCDYVNFASPLFYSETVKDTGALPGKTFITLNLFPSNQFVAPKPKNGKVKLVWTSQNIGRGRGLELLFPYLSVYQNEIELHLTGHVQPDFYESHLSAYSNIIVHDPLPQSELHQSLSEYDIGLALETGKDFNYGLAVTNKLCAYFQSGLFILATNTDGQSGFIKKHPLHGLTFSSVPNKMNEILDYVLSHIDEIRANAQFRFEEAGKLSWETESEELLAAWEHQRNLN